MELKSDTVSFQSLAPQLVLALVVANEVYNEYGVELVITSANDSGHGPSSLHYAGAAVDLRTRTLKEEDRQEVRDKIQEKLNIDFDVVLESDHIHLEYQPKRRD